MLTNIFKFETFKYLHSWKKMQIFCLRKPFLPFEKVESPCECNIHTASNYVDKHFYISIILLPISHTLIASHYRPILSDDTGLIISQHCRPSHLLNSPEFVPLWDSQSALPPTSHLHQDSPGSWLETLHFT